MRYPHDNFNTEWNITAGYGFGDKTNYGYHEGCDVNDNGGGNSDLGKPIYAIADGVVTSVHNHTSVPTFGNHLHYQIDGSWGTRYVHHAHCQDILVKVGDQVKEGQMIAKVGNSGTGFAHDHWAIKKKPTGIDAIASNITQLNDGWENPVAFVEKYREIIAQPTAKPFTDQTKIPGALLGESQDAEIQQIRGWLQDGKRDNLDLQNTRESLRLSQLSNETLTKQLRQALESPVSPPSTPNMSSQPQFTTSLGKLFYSLARTFG